MSQPSPFLPTGLETAPTAASGGHAPAAIGASLVVHVAAALLGLAVGVRQAAELQVRSGEADADERLTLQAVAVPPQQPEISRLPPLGSPELPSWEPSRPVDLPEVELAEASERAATQQRVEEAIAELLQWNRGEPDAEPQTTPDMPLESQPVAEPVERPAEAAEPAAASEATVANEKPAGAEAEIAAKPLPTNDPPVYPPAAVAEQRQGRVLLKVDVDTEGRAVRVEVLRSSGHLDLDAAAQAAVKQWRFSPALEDEQPVTQTIAVPVRFVHQEGHDKPDA